MRIRRREIKVQPSRFTPLIGSLLCFAVSVALTFIIFLNA